MKIALIWPRTPFLIDPFVHPPLGLWYLWSVLEQYGHKVEFFDLNADPIPMGFDVYLVSGTTPQAGELKKLPKLLDGRAIIGGPHATLFPEQMLKWGYDTVVAGEGERVLHPLVIDCQKRGIIRAERIQDLDKLPFPNRSQAHRYHFDVGRRDATTMFTSRGCPFKCAFCSHVIWGRRCIQRSAENVIDEIKELCDLGYDAVHFFDDTFTLNRKRLLRICELLAPLGILWRCFLRVDTVDMATLWEMARAGCVEIGVGIESGSQVILDNISKGTTVLQNTQVVGWAKRAGIAVKAFIILGLPGENKDTLAETRRWLALNRPAKLDLVFYTPYPHTPITDNPQDYDIQWEYDNFGQCFYKSHPDDFKPLAWTSGITQRELEEARRVMLEEYA